ncbi:Cytochrome c6 [Symbiodinium microadriaticum]|uniref:Cytochrome c-553 n=1 Tax=Symbiodinium microadriaticum TaxID=2951 RepID=A0A1Q9BZI9_SYMMI|nr:Cytochrome c6 [Symbiodinium microadriaticum]
MAEEELARKLDLGSSELKFLLVHHKVSEEGELYENGIDTVAKFAASAIDEADLKKMRKDSFSIEATASLKMRAQALDGGYPRHAGEDEALDKKRIIHDATHGPRVLERRNTCYGEHEEDEEVAFSVVGDIAKVGSGGIARHAWSSAVQGKAGLLPAMGMVGGPTGRKREATVIAALELLATLVGVALQKQLPVEGFCRSRGPEPEPRGRRRMAMAMARSLLLLVLFGRSAAFEVPTSLNRDSASAVAPVALGRGRAAESQLRFRPAEGFWQGAEMEAPDAEAAAEDIWSPLRPLLLSLLLGLSAGLAGAPARAADLENGQGIFLANCAACHAGGNNAVQPDKKLKKEALETYGMFDVERIKYQVTNGKNAMPAFGERLGPEDIEDVANYVIDQANKGWS